MHHPRTPDYDLLLRYHRDGDFEARGVFIERSMSLVYFVVRRYTQRGQSDEDLVQAGSIGLVKAVDRFRCRARRAVRHLRHPEHHRGDPPSFP